MEVELFRAENRYVSSEPMSLRSASWNRWTSVMTSSTRQRQRGAQVFDQAMALFDTDPAAARRRRFREATEVDPSMADAWLGRIAAGDEALSTRCSSCTRTGHGCTGRPTGSGFRLSAPIKAGPYLSISVTEASHAGLALASALIDDRQFEKAEAVLGDSALLDTWENHQWQQYMRAYLMFATQRWPDVISVAAAMLPPQAIIMSAVTAANQRAGRACRRPSRSGARRAGMGRPRRAALRARRCRPKRGGTA